MTTDQHEVRVAAIGDVHCTKTSQGALQPLFQQINDSADVLLLCGDLTDYGLPEEAHILAKELTAGLKIPVIAVFGNHDFESGQAQRSNASSAMRGSRFSTGIVVRCMALASLGPKGSPEALGIVRYKLGGRRAPNSSFVRPSMKRSS